MKESVIYKIQSVLFCNRFYIGSAVDINIRKNNHYSQLRNNKHHSKKLQNHYNKYGENDLIFSILLRCNKEDLIKHEQIFIDFYKPYFNICLKAGSILGIKRTEETKRKISIKALGNKNAKGTIQSDEIKKKHSLGNKGKVHSAEWNENNRRSQLGHKHSPESILKMSIIKKGKKFSEETKLKMSIAAKKHHYEKSNNIT